MRVFDLTDYKEFILKRAATRPDGKKGEIGRMAEHIRVHPSRLSQVLRGDLNLTPEQALSLTEYFGLTELETEYFLELVNLDRAGTEKLRRHIKKTLAKIKEQSQSLVNRLPRDQVLSEQDKMEFYSNWHPVAIRLATSISGLQDIESLSEHFEIPRAKVARIVEFLVSTGLCREESGKLKMGLSRTHLEAGSSLVNRHHANWRLKALQRHDSLSDRELAFTQCVSLSEKDQKLIRERLIQMIEEITKVVVESPEEKLVCFTMDWFEF